MSMVNVLGADLMLSILASSNVDPTKVTNVLLSPFTVVGGITAFTAGAHAAWELAFGTGLREDLQAAINYGIARGFIVGAAPALLALAGAVASL